MSRPEGPGADAPAGLRPLLLRVAGNIRISIVLKAASSLLGLAYTALVSRALGPRAFGELNFVLSYWTMYTLPIGLGIASPFLVRYAAQREDRGRLVSTAFSIAVLTSLVMYLVCAAASTGLAFAPERDQLIRIVAVGLLVAGYQQVTNIMLQAAEDFSGLSGFQLARVACNLGGAVVALRSSWGLPGLIAASIVANLVVTSLQVLYVARHTPLRPGLDRGIARELVAAGVPMLVGSITLGLIAKLDVFMLDHFRGTEQVGHYAAALRFVEIAGIPLTLTLAAVFPAAARRHELAPEERRRLHYQAWRGIMLVSAPLAVGLLVAARPLLDLLFGAGFRAAELPLQVSAALVLTSCFVGAAHQTLIIEGREWELCTTSLAALALNGLANLWVIPRYGAAGAAATSLLAGLYLVGTLHRRTRESTGLTAARLVSGEVVRTYAAAAAMGAVVLALGQVHLAIVLPVAGATYAAAVLALGAVRPAEARRILTGR